MHAEQPVLLLPAAWQLSWALERLGGQIIRLGTQEDGFRNAGREEGQLQCPADLAGRHAFEPGQLIDRWHLSTCQAVEPAMNIPD